jgi:hypothetical protein
MNLVVNGLHVFIIGFLVMMMGFACFMSNIGMEGMRDSLKDSAWNDYLSIRDYVWWTSGILGLCGLGLLALSFKIEWYGGPE